MRTVIAFTTALVFAASVTAQDPTYDLTIDGADRLVGGPGSVVSTSYDLMLTQGSSSESGAQGWTLSVVAGGCMVISDISDDGTLSAEVADGGLRDAGFAVHQLTTRAEWGSGCEGRSGAIQAIVLAFFTWVVLPPAGPNHIAVLTVEAAIPEEGCADGTVEYVDGCQGSGQPFSNHITWQGMTVVPSLDSMTISCCAGGLMRRGDATANGVVDIADPIATLNFLFLRGTPPVCLDASDSDDSGEIVLTDAVYTLRHLFLGGPEPPAPFPECGPDPTDDDLTCDEFAPCGVE